jgi:hypothetical protein
MYNSSLELFLGVKYKKLEMISYVHTTKNII